MKVPGFSTIFQSTFTLNHTSLYRKVAGLQFKNPVGLAAGFDKDGKYVAAMAMLGFSHIEIGTVTPLSQHGNPKPRLFRLIQSRALINRMGFNNDGVEALAQRLQKIKVKDLVIGANIGKNKDTPNEQAVNDYLICFRRLYDLVDYFTVNVSSPNTPGLRALQDREPLTHLLSSLQAENKNNKPIFLKIAPDLTTQQLDEIVEIILDTNLSGIIATNTTITRNNLKEDPSQVESVGAGGLSGAPILTMSENVVRYISQRSEKRFAVIGVGGIEDFSSAQNHLAAGADLVQVYSGLIYTGPGLVKQILKGLLKKK